MFLVTDGTTGVMTNAIVVESEKEIDAAVKTLLASGVDADAVTINPVGPPIC